MRVLFYLLVSVGMVAWQSQAISELRVSDTQDESQSSAEHESPQWLGPEGTSLLAGRATPWQPRIFTERHPDGVLVEVSGGLELFRWQEFGEDNTRLLTEQGQRVYFRFSRNNDARQTTGTLYHLTGSLYGGDVEYDGQTQSFDPNVRKEETGYFSAANVDYAGASGELGAGYRFTDFIWGRSLDLVAGVGIDSWTREIANGISSQGETVLGLVEDYKIAYSRAAIGMESRKLFWRTQWRAGIKYPFFTKETLDTPSVELEPEGRPSAFFMYRVQLTQNSTLNEGTFIYFVYDSYRFAKSPVAASGNFLFRQPRSSMDVVSLSIGRAF